MTEPFPSPENTVINSDFVESRTMSFSLWTVVAEHSNANSRPQNLKPGVGMHPQSTDELSAPVALLQSRTLSAATPDYASFPIRPTQQNIPQLTLNQTNVML
jgi:hypothetical protein